MPVVVVKTGPTLPFGSSGAAAEFLDFFLEKAGFAKEQNWEARLDGRARCSWDSPPIRVVGYKHRVVYLRVKPSVNAAVDHLVSLLIPNGGGYTSEMLYRRLKAIVPSFDRFVRVHGRRVGIAPEIDPGSPPIRVRVEAQEFADANRRLEENRRKYGQLQSEMALLDEEYHELTKRLVNRVSRSSPLPSSSDG